MDMKNMIMKGRKAEYAVFLVFIMLYVIITAFHEPWFDEAQAWQIGKCASLHDILFEVPHYEGHPAFWSLLLAIPAKLGAPFEVSLKAIGLLVSTASVWLILFKSSYPRLMKLVLPFTYFIFYQYGVIVRPYGIMILAFLLLAVVFPERHSKPWRFVGLLILLCLTGAYAIVMAGGIALCYVWEIIKEKRVKRLFTEICSDKRTQALLTLLCIAILLVLQIMPREDTIIASANGSNSPLKCFFVLFFTLLGESTLTTSSWLSTDTTVIQHVNLNTAELAVFVFINIILWSVIIAVSSKKAVKYFVLPYLLLTAFGAFVYFGVHHVGVAYALLLFWLGILFQDPERYEIGNVFALKIAKTEKDKKLLHAFILIVGFACLLTPVYWTTAASLNDIQKEYYYGRQAAKWMREHKLEDSLILSVWGGASSNKDIEIKTDSEYSNINLVGTPVLLNAYFDHNICMNLNYGLKNEGYMHYRIATREESSAAMEHWKETGIPEVLLGRPKLSEIYGDEISYEDYTVVYLAPINRIWKYTITFDPFPVYARNDILEEHELTKLYDEGLEYRLNGIRITDEMREQFENGVPVEEILKPYLDALLGEEK